MKESTMNQLFYEAIRIYFKIHCSKVHYFKIRVVTILTISKNLPNVGNIVKTNNKFKSKKLNLYNL